MAAVKRHYRRVKMETADPTPLRLSGLEPPIVVIPMARWNKIAEKALRFGMTLSPTLKVVHVDSDDEDADGDRCALRRDEAHATIRPNKPCGRSTSTSSIGRNRIT